MKEHDNVLEGFIKGAEEQGCNGNFVRGYVGYYQGLVDEASDWIKQAEEKSGDPAYRLKLAEEILKTANLQAGFDKALSGIGDLFGQGSELGGTILGGGGSALIGLLLANALGL
jgi:hypothetical protein